MSDEDWEEWSDYHFDLFRWNANSLEDGRMVGLWRPSFEARSVTKEEMKEASLALAQSPKAGIWRAEHLQWLLNYIVEVRAQEQARARPVRGAPVCELCRDSGVVSVPDLRPGAGKQTALVTCSCELGVARQQSNAQVREYGRGKRRRPVPRMLTIVEYERRMPDWREVMVRRQQEALDKVAKGRGPLSGAVDEVLGKAKGDRDVGSH